VNERDFQNFFSINQLNLCFLTVGVIYGNDIFVDRYLRFSFRKCLNQEEIKSRNKKFNRENWMPTIVLNMHDANRESIIFQIASVSERTRINYL
jgi:hypothetical protein